VTERTLKAARIDRLFLIAFVPVIIFMMVSLYVRFTGNPDPLWTEFSMPLFLGLLGARSMAVPGPPESRKATRAAGVLLILCAALILLLTLLDS
jgi:hypothetical protein